MRRRTTGASSVAPRVPPDCLIEMAGRARVDARSRAACRRARRAAAATATLLATPTGKPTAACTFSISLCINNSDPRLTSCSPSDIQRLRDSPPRARPAARSSSATSTASWRAAFGPGGSSLGSVSASPPARQRLARSLHRGDPDVAGAAVGDRERRAALDPAARRRQGARELPGARPDVIAAAVPARPGHRQRDRRRADGGRPPRPGRRRRPFELVDALSLASPTRP